MREFDVTLKEPEYCTLQGLRKIRKCVRSMSGDELRRYEPHYVTEDVILEKYRHNFCDDCGAYVEEPDINVADCMCGLDITDKACYRSYIYDRIKAIIIEEDFMLRIRLGSRWDDEYDDFLRGIYV